MKVGFIGLGAMGYAMAANLHKTGLLGGVWNRNPVRAAEFCSSVTGPAHSDVSTLAAECDVLVICVSADEDVLAMVDTLLPCVLPDTLVIDCSTVSRETAVEAARRLAGANCQFLDAPVSGGTEGARNGTLTFMVGGSEADFARALPAFQAMGQRIEHMGPVGTGQATKAVNQVMCAGINQAVCEALAFAEALDLPMEQVIGVIGSGAAGNWFVNHRGATMLRGEYPPGFKLALHLKDLNICHLMAEQAGGRLPLVEQTIEDYRELVDAGHGDDDISALYRSLRGLFPRQDSA